MIVERVEATKAIFQELSLLLFPDMVREVAIAPFHLQTALENGWRALSEGMTFVARDVETGPILGSVCLVRVPLWYSKWPENYQIVDSWFYVHPDFRGTRIAAKLVSAARTMGRTLDRPTFIRVVNPNKREKLIRLV